MTRFTLPTLLAVLLGLLARPAVAQSTAPARPNILWLTTEDIGPHLGCYGDPDADTPNLDAFAKRSLQYQKAWSNAPVCAPARTTIITGVYPTATGSEHMRSRAAFPAGLKMVPQILREAGYYCTNNVKEDYNLEKPGQVWDESSNKAHYKNRPAGKPFFAVFNHVGTHESQIRKRPHEFVHDPAKIHVPPYHPDVPEARQDWAQYHDNITVMDRWFADKLAELDKAGLADDTIVFFYGDHGSGMPRSKRTPCNSGLRVPFLVHVPAKFKHLAPADYVAGGKTDRLISFVDLAPTLCSLIGVKPPEWMQGSAFMGQTPAAPREYVFGFRGRMDERMDLVRSASDGRFVYVRNFMPYRPAGQHNDYMFQTPTTRVWKRLFDEGKLNDLQSAFWQPRSGEELYDLAADPFELRNLATSLEHGKILRKMRTAVTGLMIKSKDVGLLPEGEIHSRSAGSSPYEYGRTMNEETYVTILQTAEDASNTRLAPPVASFVNRLSHPDSAVRYWGAVGLLANGKRVIDDQHDRLVAVMTNPHETPYVRIVAAEAVGRYGSKEDAAAALDVLLPFADVQKNGVYVAVPALTAIDEMGARAAPAKDRIVALPKQNPATIQSMREYVPRLLEHIEENLGVEGAKPATRPAE